MVDKFIILSRGTWALVDGIDFDWLNQWKWTYDPSRCIFSSLNKAILWRDKKITELHGDFAKTEAVA